jgi:hypothetical protein
MDGVRLEAETSSERWPIRAVTGTIAEQRRDDETGRQGLPAPCWVAPQAGRTGDSEE